MGASRYVRAEAGVKVDQKTLTRVDNLAKVLRRRVVLVDRPGEGKYIKQGWYDHRSGTLYANVRSNKAIAWIIGHELTHALESTEAYGSLHRMVIRHLESNGTDLAQMRKDIRGMYAQMNVPLENEAAVDKEIVANYIADNLFTNEKAIQQLVAEDMGLGRRILDWIIKMLDRFNIHVAPERVFLQKAADLYSKALTQSEQSQATRYAQEERAEAQADLESGRMTQEEYDEYLDSLDQDEEQAYGFLPEHLSDEDGQVQYSVGRNPGRKKEKKKQKTFAKDQNANGVFVANILFDLAEDGGEWWTGTYDYVILSMDVDDSTEFRNFYKEIHKRTVNMEDSTAPTEDSFTVQDGNGKEYIYVVELDGYMHGVVLEKIYKEKYMAAHLKLIAGGKYGQSNQNITRRIRSARSNIGRNHSGNGRPARSRNAGYGRVDRLSANADLARNDEGKGPAYQGVSTVTDGDKQFSIGENPEYQEETEDAALQNVQEHETGRWESVSRENLPTKARDYIARKERDLVVEVTKALGVDRFSDRNYLKEAVRSLSDEFLETGTISKESMDAVFEEAYRQGIIVDSVFYNAYKHIRVKISTTPVTLSKQDQSSIADIDIFRADANKHRVLRIVDKGGMPVDSAYRELQEMAPELFPESITHPADQLQHMYEVANSIFVMEKNLNDHYGPDAANFKYWAKNAFEQAVWKVAPDLRQAKRISWRHCLL